MARRRLVDPQVLLHRRRRAADLPAGLRTLGVGQQTRAARAGCRRPRRCRAGACPRGSPRRAEPRAGGARAGRQPWRRGRSWCGAATRKDRINHTNRPSDGRSRTRRRARMGDVREATAALAARLREIGVVPVVELPRTEDAVPLAGALLAGGLSCVEITLRTPGAVEGIAAIRAAYPGHPPRRGHRAVGRAGGHRDRGRRRLRRRARDQPAGRRGEPRARAADPPGRRDAQRDRDRQSARDLACSSSSPPSCSAAPRTCARSAGPIATSRSCRRGRSRRRRCPATSRCRRCSPAAGAGWSSPR